MCVAICKAHQVCGLCLLHLYFPYFHLSQRPLFSILQSLWAWLPVMWPRWSQRDHFILLPSLIGSPLFMKMTMGESCSWNFWWDKHAFPSPEKYGLLTWGQQGCYLSTKLAPKGGEAGRTTASSRILIIAATCRGAHHSLTYLVLPNSSLSQIKTCCFH